METMKVNEELSARRCIEDAFEAWREGKFSLDELYAFHQEISELSRQAHSEEDFAGDVDAVEFMHHVTDLVYKQLRTTDGKIRIRNRVRRSHV